MISYKYKLYNSKHNKHLSAMLMDASFVWNHCLALHKRYYRMFGKFINANRLKTHFAKRYKMQRLHSQTVQEVIERPSSKTWCTVVFVYCFHEGFVRYEVSLNTIT